MIYEMKEQQIQYLIDEIINAFHVYMFDKRVRSNLHSWLDGFQEDEIYDFYHNDMKFMDFYYKKIVEICC